MNTKKFKDIINSLNTQLIKQDVSSVQRKQAISLVSDKLITMKNHAK